MADAQASQPAPDAEDAHGAGAAVRPQRARLAEGPAAPAPAGSAWRLPAGLSVQAAEVAPSTAAFAAAPPVSEAPLLGPPPPPAVPASAPGPADAQAWRAPAWAAAPALAEPATPDQVAQAAAALATLPFGHQVSRHRRPRREQLRRLRGLAADDELALALLGAAGAWSRTLRQATAAGWADLALARAAAPLARSAEAATHVGAPAPTSAGLVIAGSAGTCAGDAEALIAALEAERARIRPQRGSRLPWLHLVGTYGRRCPAQQMLHDSLAVMRGIALLPEERPWTLFGHDDHWHLIAGRVGGDGRSWQKVHNLTTRLTVDVLEAESGWRTGYDAPGGHRSHSAWAYHRLAEGTLANRLLGRAEDGTQTCAEMPVQGPAWAARLAGMGPLAERVSGLLVLCKPSYAGLGYIVRHCVEG